MACCIFPQKFSDLRANFVAISEEQMTAGLDGDELCARDRARCMFAYWKRIDAVVFTVDNERWGSDFRQDVDS